MPRLLVLSLVLVLAVVAGCAAPGYARRGDDYRAPIDGYARCPNCGLIERIDRVYGEPRSNGGGALLGAIIGGVIGNQFGHGDGRAAATAAGALLGGAVGDSAERDANAAARYELFVRMDDGRRLVVAQRDLRGLREGDQVRLGSAGAYPLR